MMYGQASVAPPGHPGLELDDAFVGQQNGLCGAAVTGVLFLHTGLHTGYVGFAIDVLAAAPPLEHVWEDIVEVSFTPQGRALALLDWYGERVCDVPLTQGTGYRVRYSARGMDAGHALDTCPDGTTMADHYQLTFWPAAVTADRVVKQTSANAAYWHAHAQSMRAST